MKKLASFLSILALCLPSFGGDALVTTLSGSSAKTVVIPSTATRVLYLVNVGSVTINISFTGGSGYTDPNTGLAGVNPTSTTGFPLLPNIPLIITSGTGSQTQANIPLHNPIVAIGASTLRVGTDDGLATFPTP